MGDMFLLPSLPLLHRKKKERKTKPSGFLVFADRENLAQSQHFLPHVKKEIAMKSPDANDLQHTQYYRNTLSPITCLLHIPHTAEQIPADLTVSRPGQVQCRAEHFHRALYSWFIPRLRKKLPVCCKPHNFKKRGACQQKASLQSKLGVHQQTSVLSSTFP